MLNTTGFILKNFVHCGTMTICPILNSIVLLEMCVVFAMFAPECRFIIFSFKMTILLTSFIFLRTWKEFNIQVWEPPTVTLALANHSLETICC
jgi:hypothetical protein